MKNIENLGSRKLIDAALEHLALERAAACVLQVPDTDPPLFVAAGPAPAIAQLLPFEPLSHRAEDPGTPACAHCARLPGDPEGACDWIECPVGAPAEADTIVQAVADLFRACGFEVREEGGQFAVVGSIDAAGMLVEAILEDAGAFKETARAAPALADVEHDDSEGGHHD